MVHAALKSGNVAVITGAGFGGIGFAVASTLASRFSMQVVLADISRDALDEAEKHLVAQGVPEDRFETTVLDVGEPSSKGWFELADHVYQKHGHVDFLHLNAGVGGPSKSYGADMLEAFQKIMAVNLRGVLAGSAAFVERMVAQVSTRVTFAPWRARPFTSSGASPRPSRRRLTEVFFRAPPLRTRPPPSSSRAQSRA